MDRGQPRQGQLRFESKQLGFLSFSERNKLKKKQQVSKNSNVLCKYTISYLKLFQHSVFKKNNKQKPTRMSTTPIKSIKKDLLCSSTQSFIFK